MALPLFRIHPLGLGDDNRNIEEDFITWKEELWTSVCQRFNLTEQKKEFKIHDYELIEHAANSVPEEEIFRGEVSKLNRIYKDKS